MRIVKLGLISFVFLFLLVFLISLLIPSRIRISRATNVPNRPDSVWALVRNEPRWHPAYADTAAAAYLRRLQRTAPEQSDSTFVYTLRHPGRKAVTSGWQLHGNRGADSLTLQWYMDFQLSWYPWEKFSSLFYESTYGNLMERGLVNLKRQL